MRRRPALLSVLIALPMMLAGCGERADDFDNRYEQQRQALDAQSRDLDRQMNRADASPAARPAAPTAD